MKKKRKCFYIIPEGWYYDAEASWDCNCVVFRKIIK